MRWLLGSETGVLFMPHDWSWSQREYWQGQLCDPTLVYGGFVCEGIEDLEETLTGFHSRLCLDFRTGWSAVALTVRGVGAEQKLGPFSAPTTARAYPEAPLGLYLLSRDRLLSSLPTGPQFDRDPMGLCNRVHRSQKELGCFFCDPALEVQFRSHLGSGVEDFQFRVPTQIGRLKSLFRQCFRAEVSR